LKDKDINSKEEKMHDNNEASTTTPIESVVIVDTADILSDPLGDTSPSTSDESLLHQDVNSSSTVELHLIGM